MWCKSKKWAEEIRSFELSGKEIFFNYGWGGGEGGADGWGAGAVDGGSVNAFLAAALTRVIRAAVPIPAVAAASVLHSADVCGSVVGVVGPL